MRKCNNRTNFYQGKMEHFEKHLGDYIHIIMALKKRKPESLVNINLMKKYEQYFDQIKSAIASFSKMKTSVVSKIKQCNENPYDNVDNMHFNNGNSFENRENHSYETRETSKTNHKNSVDIDKIKSFIDSTK